MISTNEAIHSARSVHGGRRALVVSGALLLASCLSFSPKDDPTRYFVLSATAERSAGGGVGQVALGIRRVTLPEYLERPELAVRKDEREIEYLRYHTWGEPLDEGIQRVLRDSLMGLLNTRNIRLTDWPREVVDLELSVEMLRFDIGRAGGVTLHALWHLTRSVDRRRVFSDETRVSLASEDVVKNPQPALDAMNSALGTLAQQIAAGIQKATQGASSTAQGSQPQATSP